MMVHDIEDVGRDNGLGFYIPEGFPSRVTRGVIIEDASICFSVWGCPHGESHGWPQHHVFEHSDASLMAYV
jgi:hypothetical protein